MKIGALILLLLASNIATAGVYKCVDPAGRVTYSQSPCAADAQRLDIKNNRQRGRAELDSPGLRDSELRALEDIRRRAERRRSALDFQAERIRRRANYDAEMADINKRACERARFERDSFRDEKRAGYSASRGKHLDEMIARYEMQMDDYCR